MDPTYNSIYDNKGWTQGDFAINDAFTSQNTPTIESKLTSIHRILHGLGGDDIHILHITGSCTVSDQQDSKYVKVKIVLDDTEWNSGIKVAPFASLDLVGHEKNAIIDQCRPGDPFGIPVMFCLISNYDKIQKPFQINFSGTVVGQRKNLSITE